MARPLESAQLNLQLFDLRREPVLREARAWFLHESNPESFTELATLVSGGRNAAFRMVLGYWEMAASLVTDGAIEANAFLAAHNEMIATFSKINPFLTELRAVTGGPDFGRHIEAVVMSSAGAQETMERRRERIRSAVKKGTAAEASAAKTRDAAKTAHPA